MTLLLPILTAVAAFSAAPLAGANQDPNDLQDREITVRGCVQEAAKKGHYVLTRFAEVPPPGVAAMPAYAHGRRVLFWLEDLPKLDKYLNRMVEVRGDFIEMKESQSDPKVQDGSAVVELEGPGRDVDLSAGQARELVGTAGTEPMKTLLIRVDVDDVKEVAGSCN